jgi:pimeloyl-ACP methyl ester carboxylesterase
VATHIARDLAAAPSASSSTPFVTVPAVDGTHRRAEPVRIAYRDAPALSHAGLPLLLLHGSPGQGRVFADLIRVLGPERRLIVPDLPGFGESSARLPDYSFAAHGRYVLDLLDHLQVPKAHMLAFSMGGGVAVTIADREPARLASLVLLSAIGVQEMELLGEYHMNHVVHGVQLVGVWILRHLVPHTASLDEAWSYARNFYDSDQRPLRGALSRIDAPTLILHGREDALVPLEAAHEHARLVPQAEIRVVEGGHFMALQNAPALAPIVTAFLDRVDRGLAPTRARTAPAGIAASRETKMVVVPRARAVTAAVLGVLVATASALAGHVAATGAGVLLAQGRLGPSLAALAVTVGATLAAYRRRAGWRGTGRAVGVAVLTVTAGAALALPLLPVGTWSAWSQAFTTTAIVAPVTWLARTAVTYRGRRLLVSSWRRLTRWEFWPAWAAYLPVVPYLAWLMLKHRSVTVFTAVNPGIPAGGVVGESKSAILRGLGEPNGQIAASTLVMGGLSDQDKQAHVAHFVRERGLALPLVLKPDAGQRGSGVVVARTDAQLRDALAASTVDTVVQEFVGGLEFGVFYHRRPSEAHGHILSITEKRLPFVLGDGVRTVEQLILDDDRAVCMARFHLRQQRERLAEVPAAGVVASLGDCGSHCRGALFLDGSRFESPALLDALERLARPFAGFYFGRFDLRVPSTTALIEGRGLKVLELNGVTSEPTHIYDPAVPLIEAYRALFRQWRLAFEIGAENVERGARPATLAELARLGLAYGRQAAGHLTH